jgi:hypothetical protein
MRNNFTANGCSLNYWVKFYDASGRVGGKKARLIRYGNMSKSAC